MSEETGYQQLNQAGHGGSKKSAWWRTTALMIANMLGTGVLGLPAALATMGWGLGAGWFVLLTAGCVYSGLLLSRLRQHVPSATIYADLGYAAFGERGQMAVKAVGYTFIGGVTVVMHLTAALALQDVFYDSEFCLAYASAIVLIAMLPLAQVRHLHEVSIIAVIGVICILVPLGIVIGELFNSGREKGAKTEVWVGSSLEDTVVAMMNLVYAYAGQVIFVELITEMATPSDFPKAVYASSTVMAVAYFSTSVVGYWFLGAAARDSNPITGAIPDNWLKRAANVILFVHVVVAYVIECNILSRAILLRISPRYQEVSHSLAHAPVPTHSDGENGDEPSGDGTPKVAVEHLTLPASAPISIDSAEALHDPVSANAYRVAWFAVTCGVVGSSYLMTNIIPFLSDVVSLVGALCSVATTYTIPAACTIKLLAHKIPKWELYLNYALVPLSLMLALTGVISSAYSIIHKLLSESAAAPFSC